MFEQLVAFAVFAEQPARINVQLCTILVPQQKCSSASWTIDNEGLKSVSEEYWSAYGLDHSMLGSLEKQLDVEWSNFQKIYNGPCSGQACIGRYKDLIEASQKNADVAEQILKTISDSM